MYKESPQMQKPEDSSEEATSVSTTDAAPSKEDKKEESRPGPKAEVVERLLWVILPMLVAGGLASAAGWFYPGAASMSAVSTRIGVFATFIGLAAFVAQLIRAILWKDALRPGWILTGVEGAGLTLALVAFLLIP